MKLTRSSLLTAVIIVAGLLSMTTAGHGAVKKVATVEVINILEAPATPQDSGTARVVFRIVDGPGAGDTLVYNEHMWGNPHYDPNLKKGSVFMAEFKYDKEGNRVEVILNQQKKDWKLLLLFIIVTIFLFAVGRWEGLFGLISTCITLGLILYFFFPMIFIPNAVLPVGLAICLITIVITISLIMRWDRATFPAIVSLTIVLLAITGATIIGFRYLELDASLARHSRLIIWELNKGYEAGLNTPLQQLWKLLTIGIVLGTLGAMMDVAVVISSTINEIVRDATHIDFREAFRSGMTVGREILSTMVNTLIFAYLGILFPLLLAFKIYDLSLLQFLNYDFVGIEILRISIGLLGLSLIIPITSALSAWWCRE